MVQKQKVFQIDNVDVNRISVSKKEPYGTKNAFKYLKNKNKNICRQHDYKFS